MKLEDQTILVTGGFGAVGSNLVNAIGKGNCVVMVDNSTSGRVSFLDFSPNVEIVHSDIRDYEIMEVLFSKWKFDYVFHLAAHFANQNSVDHPLLDLDVNGKGFLQLLNLCVRYKVKRLLYTSTSGVYGGNTEDMREECIGDLETPYYIHKMLGEYYCQYFGRQFFLPYVIVRLFNSYGPGELWGKYRNVIPNFFRKAMAGEPLVITGTGEETRDFTWVGDVIEALEICILSKNTLNQEINIGTGKQTRIFDLAKKINALTENNAEIQFVERRSWDGVIHRKANIEKIFRLTGWKATCSLDTGLSIYYDWLRRRKDDSHYNACL